MYNPFLCTPIEVKLLLRLRQLYNQDKPMALINLSDLTISLVGQPEYLKKDEKPQDALTEIDKVL